MRHGESWMHTGATLERRYRGSSQGRDAVGVASRQCGKDENRNGLPELGGSDNVAIIRPSGGQCERERAALRVVCKGELDCIHKRYARISKRAFESRRFEYIAAKNGT